MKTEHVLTEDAVVQPHIKNLTQSGPGPELCVVEGGLVTTIFSSLIRIFNQGHKGLPNVSTVQDLQTIMFGIQVHLMY